MSVGIIGHYDCRGHDMGNDHPESPARMSVIQDQIISSRLEFLIREYDAKPIKRELLELVHSKEYIHSVFDNAPSEGKYQLNDDTILMPKSLNSALLAAGATVDAVDLVMDRKIESAFCSIRPPGHHAERDRSMGFCIFNNIAIAAAYAKEKYNLKRIAIVDFDVHHGNGTENIFEGQNEYLFCSTFEFPLYPLKEIHTPKSNIINTPLKAVSKSKEFREAVERDWLPALNAFKPEFIFISAGFDAHIEDDISGMSLLESDYNWVTIKLKEIADKYSKGRIVSALEGGYALSALSRSVVAHINGLLSH